MIRTLAALALLTASTHSIAAASPDEDELTLSSTAPWWEKVTVTLAGDGKTHSCRYETSLDPKADTNCEVSGDRAALGKSSGSKAEITSITFERRFTPGVRPAHASLHPGDTLLGQQVMALAIDAAGTVKGCTVVAASGELTPDYGCKEATAEKFEASVKSVEPAAREGVMTILVYGHAEHIV